MWLIRQQQPVNVIWVNRFLVVLVILLSLLGGYFFTRYTEIYAEYKRLEDTKLELLDLEIEPLE